MPEPEGCARGYAHCECPECRAESEGAVLTPVPITNPARLGEAFQPCPRCGGAKECGLAYAVGTGYLITLECAAGCGWREVL